MNGSNRNSRNPLRSYTLHTYPVKVIKPNEKNQMKGSESLQGKISIPQEITQKLEASQFYQAPLSNFGFIAIGSTTEFLPNTKLTIKIEQNGEIQTIKLTEEDFRRTIKPAGIQPIVD